jgi:TonB-linked SusC/RagA family outer membrane protein
MKKNVHLFISVIFCLVCSISVAQQRQISGTVVDDEGEPLLGVNVIIVGTSTGTQTDLDGKYSLDVIDSQSLAYSYIGFQKQTIAVGTKTVLNVTLLKDLNNLDEVLVVGYGTQSKRTLTDNISKLSSEDIEDIPVSNFQNTLVAKAAGVQVTQTNGKVEGGMNIRIRGAASISAGTQPLYVIDGIPLYNQNESSNGAPVNPLLTLSPNEIESIDILKDASSAAIYGARGSNGVVLITTKQGKDGKSVFSANVSGGTTSATNTRDFLNSAQYVELFREAAINSAGIFGSEAAAIAFVESRFDRYSNGTDWRNNEIDTDWQSLALRDGQIYDADFSARGGNAKTKFFFSGAFNDTKGIVLGNDLQRFNARSNVSHKFSDKFNAGMNLSYSRTVIDRIANDNAFVTPLQAIAQTPLTPAFLEDGTANPNTLYPNFLLQEQNAFYQTIIRRVTGSVYGDYEFIDGLKLNSNFAYDLYYQTEDNFVGRNAPFQSTDGEAFASSVNAENYIISNFLSYDKQFGLHTIGAVAGIELNETTRRFTSVTSNQFPTDDFTTIGGGAEVVAGVGTVTANTFFSTFARFTYDYADKYLFKASIRRDGSSRFGANNQYGTFSAVSAGWVMSKEAFLADSSTLSFLKLRASYGKTGNADFGDFQSRFLFGASSYNQSPGLSFTQPGNPDLTWETSTQFDLGVDYGLLDDRITGEIDYYVKNTEGLLFNVPLILSSGAFSIAKNIGELQNQGFEFVLNTKNIQTEDLTWNTSFNIATNNNEVKSLPNDNADIINGRNILRTGETANAFYLIEYAGVDVDNGDALYVINSENADGSLNKETTNNPNEANRIVVGNPFPEVFGGLTNTVLYKDLDFSFTLQGEWGASIYNGGGIYQSANADFFDNQTTDQLNRWQNPGDVTNVPEARLFGGNGTAHSTRYLNESNFVRLRNITLGYSLPLSLIEDYSLTKFRVYVTGVNLLTFTNYEGGYDPEARSDAGGIGQEFYSVPPARIVSLGVNINF